jgi:hypothetical protein
MADELVAVAIECELPGLDEKPFLVVLSTASARRQDRRPSRKR